MITSLPSIAILIDCWKSPILNKDLEKCYERITNFLDTAENIKTVVLSSYNCRDEHAECNSIWYHNNTLMCNQATRKKIAHLHQAHNYLYKYDNKYPQEQTDPIILDYINPTKFQISMHWWWELEYYLLLHPEIKNIYFLGQAWEECIKNRSLGYEAVIEERPDLNILTNTKCVMLDDHSLPLLDLTSDLDWIHVEGSTYLYQKPNS